MQQTIPRLFITRGISGSGKSTWAHAMSAKYQNLILVSLDDIRLGCWDSFDHTDKEKQELAVSLEYALVDKALRLEQDVIVHNTTLFANFASAFRKKFGRFADIYIVDFADMDPNICIERDAKRNIPACVGEDVVIAQYKKLQKSLKNSAWNSFTTLSPQAADEILSQPRSPKNTTLYIADTSLPDTVIIDIDGTLANIEHRNPFDFTNYHLDSLNHAIAKITPAFTKSIILTGRDEKYRDVTKNWLDKHNVFYELLLMRSEGDKRPDYVVKKEIFFEQIAPYYNVELVFEDRKQVVEMWRDIGLTCAHVDEGDF